MRRSSGTPKSLFPTVTFVASGSFFDLWKDGVNYQILDSDFYASLGVTGSIEQLGLITAVPILDIQGAVNRIRNLEVDENSGISVVVSPTEGAYLALDAQGSGTGVPVLDGTNNTFRDIKSGTGISVALANGDIVISVTGTPGASNVVTVDALGDFPSPVGSVIPLAADTIYFITNIVDIGALTFQCASNTVMLGLSASVVGITSSATGNLFSNTGGHEVEIGGLRITAPNCTIFSVTSGSGVADVYVHGIDVKSCVSVASINACFLFRFEECGVDLCSAGAFSFSGACGLVNIQTNFVLDFTGTLFALGTATFDRFNVDVAQIVSTSGSNKVLEGLASSGNINAGGIGDMSEIIVIGSFTASTNILSTDVRWNFQNNSFIADSSTDALLSLQSNATPTTITVQGTAVLVAGTWVVERNSMMTGSVGGRATYDAQRSVRVPLVSSVTVEPVSGGSQAISAYYAVGGVVVANSKRTAAASPGGAASITMPWALVMDTTNYVELFVANEDGTVNVLVSSAVLSAG